MKHFVFLACFMLIVPIIISTNAHAFDGPTHTDIYSSKHSFEEMGFQTYAITEKQVKYNIPYKISHGTINDMILRCDDASLIVNVDTENSEGRLVLDIPRSVLDPKAGNEDDIFFVLIDGEEVEYEEIPYDGHRKLEITFLSDAKQIEIIQSWPLAAPKPETCKVMHDPPYSYILSPLKQLKSVNDIHDIACRDGQQLVFKKNVWLPACVYKESVAKLAERGWLDMHDPTHANMKMTNPDNKKETSIDSQSLFENITTMEPNSMELFFYPDATTYEKSDTSILRKSDTYKLFMLIRLPEWMGGAANDVSAFRAYSAKSLDDACIVKYWPDDGRQRIENPCQGGMYRVVDGAITRGLIFRSTPMTALPYLDLLMDEKGTLHVKSPTWSKTENGVVGYGREISFDDFRAGSKFLIDSFASAYPDYPKIPIEFAGYELSEIAPSQFRVDLSYVNFPDNSESLSMSISKSPVGTLINVAQSNSEYWYLGDTKITIGGSALDEDSRIPEQFRTYEIRFKDDNHYYAINGKNLEFIKKEIVRHYFPEYHY